MRNNSQAASRGNQSRKIINFHPLPVAASRSPVNVAGRENIIIFSARCLGLTQQALWRSSVLAGYVGPAEQALRAAHAARHLLRVSCSGRFGGRVA